MSDLEIATHIYCAIRIAKPDWTDREVFLDAWSTTEAMVEEFKKRNEEGEQK